MGEFVKVQGLAQLKIDLASLDENLTKKVARSAAVAAAGLLVREAKALAKGQGLELSGALVQNIAMKREKTPEGRHEYHIGVRHGRYSKKAKKVVLYKGSRKSVTYSNDPFYWWFHEFGTSKMPARPFIRPAFEANKEKMIEVMRTRMRRAIERYKARNG